MDPSRIVTINNKKVQISEPYEKKISSSYFIERPEILEIISAAWMGGPNSLPLSPILVGPPGIGKNELVYELMKRMPVKRELYIFQGHEDVTAEDLACTVRFSDSSERKLDYILSPVSTAIIKGGILFIDEIGKIRPRALSLLVSVLDDRRYIDSNLLGERLFAHKDFRFIAATNNADRVDKFLPDFISSRMRPLIFIGQLEVDQINNFIKETYKQTLNKKIESLISTFWIEWRKYLKTEKLNALSTPTPRDILQVFNLAISLSRIRTNNKRNVEEIDIDKAFIDEIHIVRSFNEIFKKSSE